MELSTEDDNLTIYCSNLSENVTDTLLFELFNQAGPVETVRRHKYSNGRPKPFAYIIYKHEHSVPAAIKLLKGTRLFNRDLNLKSRNTLIHNPVEQRSRERVYRSRERVYRSREKDPKNISNIAHSISVVHASSLMGQQMMPPMGPSIDNITLPIIHGGDGSPSQRLVRYRKEGSNHRSHPYDNYRDVSNGSPPKYGDRSPPRYRDRSPPRYRGGSPPRYRDRSPPRYRDGSPPPRQRYIRSLPHDKYRDRRD